MKVKNLRDYPQQLSDGRVIGAAGTSADEREYDLPELSKEDKRRVKRDWLIIVEEEKPAENTGSQQKTNAPASDQSKGGSK